MANTSDVPSSTGSFISTSSTAPFVISTSTPNSTESYGFNFTDDASPSNYFQNDLNVTSFLLDTLNSTLPGKVITKLNSTSSPEDSCNDWEVAQHKLFQVANFFFVIAFLVPRSFKASVLALRTFLTAGFMLTALWAGVTICSLDAMLWCLALGMLNGIHSLILACRFLPPALSPELAELYLKIFKPFKVSKKHFQELAKEARVLKLDSGQTYATESITSADERLSILLRGKLVVTCDNAHLHYIRAFQFIDSPEWEATHSNLHSVFQVTIRAEENSTYICWTRLKLLRVLRHRPLLKTIINALIGKDITTKLYALNEHLTNTLASSESMNPYRGVARSLSVDAVNTEIAGKIRSATWNPQKKYNVSANNRPWSGETAFSGESSVRHSIQYWAPVVANHFPVKSPFVQSIEYPSHDGYSLLLSKGVDFSPPPHTAVSRQRSGGPGGDYSLLPQTPPFQKRISKKSLIEET